MQHDTSIHNAFCPTVTIHSCTLSCWLSECEKHRCKHICQYFHETPYKEQKACRSVPSMNHALSCSASFTPFRKKLNGHFHFCNDSSELVLKLLIWAVGCSFMWFLLTAAPVKNAQVYTNVTKSTGDASCNLQSCREVLRLLTQMAAIMTKKKKKSFNDYLKMWSGTTEIDWKLT